MLLYVPGLTFFQQLVNFLPTFTLDANDNQKLWNKNSESAIDWEAKMAKNFSRRDHLSFHQGGQDLSCYEQLTLL